MKLLVVFIFSLFTLLNCNSQSSENLRINYRAETRGSSITLDVNSSEILYSDIDGDKKVTLSKKQWDDIKTLVFKINVAVIQDFKAPSQESRTDRALVATLSITIDDKTYESVNFDHGNPPLELKKIVDKVFQIVE